MRGAQAVGYFECWKTASEEDGHGQRKSATVLGTSVVTWNWGQTAEDWPQSKALALLLSDSAALGKLGNLSLPCFSLM